MECLRRLAGCVGGLVLAWGLGCGKELTQASQSGSESGGEASTRGSSGSPSGGPDSADGADDAALTSTAALTSGADNDSAAETSPTDPGSATVAASDDASSTAGQEGTTAGHAGSTGGAPLTCADLLLAEQAPPACSESSAAQAELVIHNDCEGITLETWWVGYPGGGCDEEYIVAVASPGSMNTVDTYATHPFRIRNQATGELMVEIAPLAPGTTVVTVP